MWCSRKAAAAETTTAPATEAVAPAASAPSPAMSPMLSHGIARTRAKIAKTQAETLENQSFMRHDSVSFLKNNPNGKTATGQLLVRKC